MVDGKSLDKHIDLGVAYYLLFPKPKNVWCTDSC